MTFLHREISSLQTGDFSLRYPEHVISTSEVGEEKSLAMTGDFSSAQTASSK